MAFDVLKAWNTLINGPENIRSVENGLKVIKPPHVAVHMGLFFSHADKHTVAAAASIDVLIIPNSGSDLNMLPFQFNSTHGPDDVYLYEAPFTDVLSLGTEITDQFHNHERTSAGVAQFSAYEDPFIDINSLGLAIDYALMEQSGGGPVKAPGGGAEGAEGEWILDPTKSYLVRFTNNNAAEATIKMGISIYTEG